MNRISPTIDEAELRRVCGIMEEISNRYELSDAEQQALETAAIALIATNLTNALKTSYKRLAEAHNGNIPEDVRNEMLAHGIDSEDCKYPWVVRTSYSREHDVTWALLKKLIEAPQADRLSGMEFSAKVRFVEDETFADLSGKDLVRALPADYDSFVVFVVDAQTMNSEEHPLIVVGFAPQGDDPQDFHRKPNQTPLDDIKSFRAIPSTVQSIENNLSIANMDFKDFANAVGRDGVFRGFPG